MKGLILAAGLGTRLRPLTSLRPKAIISVANKPIIIHAIDNLVEAGVKDIGIVVSHATITYIKDTLKNYKAANFQFILQDSPDGLAHAVSTARDFLGEDDFVMYLGDNLFEEGICSYVDEFRKRKESDTPANAVLALAHVADPRAFGVAIVENDRVVSLVEKPKDPPSDLAVMGIYVFDSSIHDIITTLKPSARGEYEITDAIQGLIQEDGNVVPVEASGWWKDTGKPHELLDANRLMLLKHNDYSNRGDVIGSKLIGDVAVAPGATISQSTIVGPAIIGAGTTIENAYIGPYTSIGNDAIVRDAEIEYSVVEEQCHIEGVPKRIQSSLFGIQVSVRGSHQRPDAFQLILGDKSNTIIPK